MQALFGIENHAKKWKKIKGTELLYLLLVVSRMCSLSTLQKRKVINICLYLCSKYTQISYNQYIISTTGTTYTSNQIKLFKIFSYNVESVHVLLLRHFDFMDLNILFFWQFYKSKFITRKKTNNYTSLNAFHTR